MNCKMSVSASASSGFDLIISSKTKTVCSGGGAAKLAGVAAVAVALDDAPAAG